VEEEEAEEVRGTVAVEAEGRAAIEGAAGLSFAKKASNRRESASDKPW